MVGRTQKSVVHHLETQSVSSAGDGGGGGADSSQCHPQHINRQQNNSLRGFENGNRQKKKERRRTDIESGWRNYFIVDRKWSSGGGQDRTGHERDHQIIVCLGNHT